MVHRVSGKDDTSACSSATRSPRARPKKKEGGAVAKTVASGLNRGNKNAPAQEKDESCGDGSEDSGWTRKSRGRSVKGCVQVMLEESSMKSVPSVVVEKVVQKLSPGGDDNDEEESVESSEDESESSDEEDSDGDTDDNVSISNLMRKQKCDLDNCASGGVTKDLHVRCSLPLHRLSDDVVETLTSSGKGTKCLDETPNGGNRFLCLYCDRSFATREIRSKHADRLHRSSAGRRSSARNLINATPSDFAGCSFCNNTKTFSGFATDLVRLFHHMMDKHGDRYFGCRECSIRWPTIEAFQKHRESVHNILPKGGVRKAPSLNDVDFDDSILASSISKLTTPKTAAIKGENGNHQGRKMMTRLSKMNKKHQLLRNEEPMLSRLGVAQNRSPRTRKGSKGRPQVESRGTSETGSSCGRMSRSKSVRTATASGSVACANDSGEFSGSTSGKLSSGKETLSSTFDDDFYETVSVNVRKNLSCYLDGKIGSDPEAPSVHTRFTEAIPAVPSTVVRSSYMTDNEIHEATSLSAITAFPTLLTAEQYGTECVSPNKSKRTITKNSWKWKWDFVKKYKYVNEGGKIVKKIKQQTSGLRDLSKLDMWTQLTMRTKHEIVQRSGAHEENHQPTVAGDAAREEKRKTIEQLNTILDTRLLPQIVLEQNDQRLIKTEAVECIEDSVETSASPSIGVEDEGITRGEEDKFVATLKLQRSGGEKQLRCHEVVLSGEWARPRCYVCFGCGAKFETIKSLEEHKTTRHPHVYSTHYEIVGRELIEGELYKHFFIPTKALRRKTEFMRQVSSDESGTVEDSMDSTTSCTISTKCDSFDTDSSSRMSNKSTDMTVCTKCKKECTGMMDLYRHMLDCVGDYAWLIAKRRLRHRYYGNRSRRRRANAKLLRFGCLRSPKPPKTPENRAITTPRKQSPQTPRTRPSDADSIQRMLANLPAKRSSRSVHPVKPIPMRRRKLIATATANKYTKRNTRTSILAAKSSGLLLRSKNKSEGNKKISKHLQQPERTTRSGNSSSIRKIVIPKRVTRSSESPNVNSDDAIPEGVTTRNKTKHLTTPIKKGPKAIAKKLSSKFSKSPSKSPIKNSPTPVKVVKSPKESSISPVSKRIAKQTENSENAQKNGKAKKVKLVQNVDNVKKTSTPNETEKPFLEETKTSDQDELVEIKLIMDSIIDRASVAVDDEEKERENIKIAITPPPISVQTKAFETPIQQKIEENAPLTSPTSTTPGKRRVRKLTDCIARLTDKLQEKLGIPFLENSTTSILAKPLGETENLPKSKVDTGNQQNEPISTENDSKPTQKDLTTKDIQSSQKDLIIVEKITTPTDVKSKSMVKSPEKESVFVAKEITPTTSIPEIIVNPPVPIAVPLVEEVIDAPLNLTVRKSTEELDNSQPICLVKHPPILKIPTVPAHLGSRLHPNEIDCNIVMDLSAKSARTNSPGTSRTSEIMNSPRQIEILPKTMEILPQTTRGVAILSPNSSTLAPVQAISSEILNQPRSSEIHSLSRSAEILKQPRPELLVKRTSPIIQIPQVPVKTVRPKQARKPRAKAQNSASKVTKTAKEDSTAEIKSSVVCENVAKEGKSDNNNVENVSQVMSPTMENSEGFVPMMQNTTHQSKAPTKDKDFEVAPESVSKLSATESIFTANKEEILSRKMSDSTEKLADKEVVHVEVSNEEAEQRSNAEKDSGGKKQLENSVKNSDKENITESTPLDVTDNINKEEKLVKGKKSQKMTKAQKIALSLNEQSAKSEKGKVIELEKSEPLKKVSKTKKKTPPQKLSKGNKRGKLEKSESTEEISQESEIEKPKTNPKISEPEKNMVTISGISDAQTVAEEPIKKGKGAIAGRKKPKVAEKLEVVETEKPKDVPIAKTTQKPKKKGKLEVKENVTVNTQVSEKFELSNKNLMPELIIEDILKSPVSAEKGQKSKKAGNTKISSDAVQSSTSADESVQIEKKGKIDTITEDSSSKSTAKKVQKPKRKGKSITPPINITQKLEDLAEVKSSEIPEKSELAKDLEDTTIVAEKPQTPKRKRQPTKVSVKNLTDSVNPETVETAQKKGKSEIVVENIPKTTKVQRKAVRPKKQSEPVIPEITEKENNTTDKIEVSKRKGKIQKLEVLVQEISKVSKEKEESQKKHLPVEEEASVQVETSGNVQISKNKKGKLTPVTSQKQRKVLKGKKNIQPKQLEADEQKDKSDEPPEVQNTNDTEKSADVELPKLTEGKEAIGKSNVIQKTKKKAKLQKTVRSKKPENVDSLSLTIPEEPKEHEIVKDSDDTSQKSEESEDSTKPDEFNKSSVTEEKSKTVQKPRKKRKNELAAIIADQLLESFKEVDKSRIDELKILHDLSCDANSNGDELLVSNAIEMVTTTKRKVASKVSSMETLPVVPIKKKATKQTISDITTPNIDTKKPENQFQTPAIDPEEKVPIDVPSKPKKSSRATIVDSTKTKIISKEKKDSVMSNLMRKLEDKGEESSEGDSSRLSSTTSKSSSSRKKKKEPQMIINKKSPPKEEMSKEEEIPQIETERERNKVSLEEVNNRVADSLTLLAAMDMNTQKNVDSQRIESEKTGKPLDWVSRVASLPKNPPESKSNTTSSSATKPKFILKPSRLQALTSSVPDPFDELKGNTAKELPILSPPSNSKVSVPTDSEKKNGEHSETVAKLVDKIRESGTQSDSDDDTCLAEIAKSLNNRILTTDEFTNVIDTLPVAETPSESPNNTILPTSQKELQDDLNAEPVDMDLEDVMSVFTSASMDSGITAGAGKIGSQKVSTVAKKRKIRRSVLYKSKKPKVTKATTESESATFFCDICKKHFSRQDRLTKHKMTITHIAKLSEQEFLDAQKNRMVEEKENESQNVENVTKTPVAEDKKDVEVTEKSVELEEVKNIPQSPVQAGIEPISSPEQVQVPPSIDRYSSPVRSHNPGTPRLNLSQEEKLFYECCNMLKGSNRIGAQSENKSLTPKSNEQPTNCFGGSHSAVYCVKSPMSHRRSSPKHAYPKIDINQFSDISSDSNPMFSRNTKFAQSKGIFEDTASSVNNQLSGFLATAEKFLNGASSTSNTLYYNDKLIDSTPPISGTNPKEPSLTGRSYSDSFSDMGDSFPSSQDASESENYAQTILDRPGSHKAIESDSAVLKDGNDSMDQGRKLFNDKHLSERSSGSPIHSTTSSQCSSISKIRTKGAMKGYDNFKVSIPTNGLDLQQALVRNPHVNSKLAALADIALSTDIPGISKQNTITTGEVELEKPKEYASSTVESLASEVKNETLPKVVKLKKTKEDIGNKLGFKSKKKTPSKESKVGTEKDKNEKGMEKNPLDVYEFEESKDSVDAPILPLSKRTFFRTNLELESSHNLEGDTKSTEVAGVEKGGNKKSELEDNASQMSSTSFSDRDDFNYNSNLSDDSDSESVSPSPKLPTTPSSVKKTKKLPDPVQKKSLIMGRIFKNAQKNRPPTDTKTPSTEGETTKRPFLQKQELDKLFDSLKSDGNKEAKSEASEELQKSSTEPDNNESNVESKGRQKKTSTSAETRRSAANRKSRELAKFEAEWGMSLEQIEEIIGIGKRKSQRKCAVGKQKILAETWSSDEYEEFQSTKDIIALIQEKELKSSQRALRNQRRRESLKSQTMRSLDDSKESEEVGAETWDVRRALGLEYKKARASKKVVRIAGGSDVETSQKTKDPPPRPAKIKKRRQTIAFRATEPSPSPERDIPIRSKRRESGGIRGTTSDGESGGRKSKKVKFPESSQATQSRPMARSKRVASEMLYYWSSSSDDEFGRINNSRDDDDDELSQEGGEVLQQHGWIVGDSHKKLVTLLAHAKGKKTEECSVKEASSGNNKKKSSS